MALQGALFFALQLHFMESSQGGESVVHAEFGIDIFQVLIDGSFADIECF